MSTTEWLFVVVLVGLPLGFLIGQGIINPNRNLQAATRTSGRVKVIDARHADRLDRLDRQSAAPPRDAHQQDSDVRMARSLHEVSAERDRLADLLERSEMERRRVQVLADETSVRLDEAERLRLRAEEVGREAGPRLIDSLSERDQALERLQAEKAAHANTHRELDETLSRIDRLVHRLNRLESMQATGASQYRFEQPDGGRMHLEDEIANIQRALRRLESEGAGERRR